MSPAVVLLGWSGSPSETNINTFCLPAACRALFNSVFPAIIPAAKLDPTDEELLRVYAEGRNKATVHALLKAGQSIGHQVTHAAVN